MIPPSANLYKNADESNGEYDSFKKVLPTASNSITPKHLSLQRG